METKRHSFLVRVAMTLLLTVLTTVTAWADDWPEYITDVKLIGGTQTKVDELKSSYQSQGWTIINVNLNEGVANSDYIFLIYKKDNHVSTNGGYVTDLYLNATAGDHPSGYSTSSITYNGHTYSRCPYDGNSAFYTYRGHLNANAGGMEIHLYYTKENFSDKRALTSITCNYSSSGALYWWNNSNDYPANLNNGNNGSAIYMHINKTTKVNRPNPEPSMASSLVYTSKPLKLIASNYTNNNPGTLYYRVNSGDYTSTVNDVTATNAGTHTVYYYSGSDSYGNSSESYAHSKTVTIAKSPNSGATVTCGNYLEGSTPNPSLTGTNLSSGTVTFKYSTSQNGSYTTTKPSAAGTYWVKATIAGDDNCYEYTTAATSFNIIYNWRLHNSGDTENDAYVISTQADLKYLAFWVNSGIDFAGKFFKLGDNIAFDKSKENNLTPIGTESHPFDGTFDGNKKTISGLNINKPNNDNVGLFGYATKEATIKNLTVDNSTITGGQLVGAILGCGDSKDVFSAKTTIENCLITSSVTVSGQFCVGGIAGEKAIINGCVCAATVSGQQQVGGIIGSNSFDVTNCLYTGTNVSGTYHIGAISGEGNTSNHFHYNYYTADVTCGGGFGQNSTDIGQDDTGGRKAVTINAADGVTVTPTGTSTAYNVSGITAYAGNSCIGYDGHIYAGATEEVNLDITCSSTYESFTGYSDGNGNALASIGGTTYTLTMPATTVTVTAQDLWGEQAEGRDGSTADKAYLITTPEGLDLLAKKVNGTDGYTANSYADTYFELGNDIAYDKTVENNFTPIGGNGYWFYGTFDGKGHTVSGIRISDTNGAYKAIFGGVFGTVKNLVVSDCNIEGRQYIGGIVGSIYSGTIENCHVLSNVTLTGNSYVGGIAVKIYEGTIKGCTSAATITGTKANDMNAYILGGIVGKAEESGGNKPTLSDNLFTGTISGDLGEFIGAIVGWDNSAETSLTNNYYTTYGLGGIGSDTGATGSDVAGASFAYEYPAATGAMGAVVSTYGTGDYTGITAYEHGLAYNGKYYCPSLWGGSGTAADPYIIVNTQGMDKLATNVNGGNEYRYSYFVLGNDIVYDVDALTLDLDNDGENDSNYMPVGNDNSPFYGNFDGQGHTISGISVNANEMYYIGVFGINDGTVKNLTVSDCLFAGSETIGAIAGYNRGTVENCHVAAYVSVTGNNGVGGIVGDNEGSVLGCTSAAALSAKEYAAYFGGIAGINTGTLTDNLFTGTIGKMPDSPFNSGIGAITGYHDTDYSTLTNNFHTCSGMGGVGNDNDATNSDQAGAQFAISSTTPPASIDPNVSEPTAVYSYTIGSTQYIGITAYEHGLYYNGKYYYWSEDIVVPGDANGDSVVTISDVVAIVNFILGKPVPEGFNPVAADMNGDGKVTITDAVMVMDMVAAQ